MRHALTALSACRPGGRLCSDQNSGPNRLTDWKCSATPLFCHWQLTSHFRQDHTAHTRFTHQSSRMPPTSMLGAPLQIWLASGSNGKSIWATCLFATCPRSRGRTAFWPHQWLSTSYASPYSSKAPNPPTSLSKRAPWTNGPTVHDLLVWSWRWTLEERKRHACQRGRNERHSQYLYIYIFIYSCTYKICVSILYMHNKHKVKGCMIPVKTYNILNYNTNYC